MLASHNQFYLVFLTVILATRLFLYLRPTPGPTVFRIRIHHYVFGIILIPIGFLAHSLIIYAAGLALLVDELTFLAIGGGTHDDNYSTLSLAGTALLCLLVFLFRAQLNIVS